MIAFLTSSVTIGAVFVLAGICCLYGSWSRMNMVREYFESDGHNVREKIRKFWREFRHPPPGESAYDILKTQNGYMTAYNQGKSNFFGLAMGGCLLIIIGALILFC